MCRYERVVICESMCVCVCVYMSACERHIKVWTHVADTSFKASLWLGSLILCLSIEKKKRKKNTYIKTNYKTHAAVS